MAVCSCKAARYGEAAAAVSAAYCGYHTPSASTSHPASTASAAASISLTAPLRRIRARGRGCFSFAMLIGTFLSYLCIFKVILLYVRFSLLKTLQ